jgi:hypothetical protein
MGSTPETTLTSSSQFLIAVASAVPVNVCEEIASGVDDKIMPLLTD